ncbi:MAG TPA: hypothetical protein VIW92_10980 [Thermoanaerobaculia bacterium]
MRSASKTLHTAAFVALLCPLFVAPAPAPAEAQVRSRSNNIGSVQILVREIGSRREIARLDPGDTLSLPEGARVRLNMMALSGRSGNPRYPATEFSDVSRGGIHITRTNEENAAADLEIVATRNPNRVETIRYRITEEWVPAGLRTGSFSIRVGPEGSTSGTWTAQRSQEITRLLYQGILMREPDMNGARSTAQAIQQGGYDAVVRAAVGLANSDESRIRVYERQGVCNEQRLLALYKTFLGQSSSQIERRQWDAQLRSMNNGEMARVVEDLLRSDRFRSRLTVATR